LAKQDEICLAQFSHKLLTGLFVKYLDALFRETPGHLLNLPVPMWSYCRLLIMLPGASMKCCCSIVRRRLADCSF